MDYNQYFEGNRGRARQGAGAVPAKDLTPTRVRVVRALLLHGEPQAVGTVLTVPKWMADDMVHGSTRAEFVR